MFDNIFSVYTIFFTYIQNETLKNYQLYNNIYMLYYIYFIYILLYYLLKTKKAI